MELTNELILLGGILLLVSVLSTALSSRLGAPLLLVFLVLGMLAGAEGPGGIRFYDYQATHLLSSLALAIILFDGGLRTKKAVFRVGLRPALSLATVGVFVTAGLTGLVASELLHLHWLEGLLLGAIISSTDAAAVFSILGSRGAAIKARVSATLEVESGTNDPMAVFLTIALVEILQSGQQTLDVGIVWFFFQQMGLGALIGVAAGYALVALINRLTFSAHGLYPLLAMAGAVLVFGLTNSLEGSGFLAVYLAGVIIGNRPAQMRLDIINFHGGLSWLMQIGMFLTLGLLSAPSKLLEVAPQGLLIAVLLMLVIRPLSVFISLLPFHFPVREQVFISWVGLRGAVPIILAIFPLLAHLPNAYLLFNIAFFVVLISLLVQGWSIGPAARWLKLEVPPQPEPLQRYDLGLPGQTDYELVAYRLEADCPALQYAPMDLSMPGQTKPVIVLRGAEVLRLRTIERMQAGDVLYLFARVQDLPPLNKLFSKPALGSDSKSQRFFGEFVLNGDVPLAEMALLYGLHLPPEQLALTLAELIVARLHTRPVVGDRVKLDNVELVVKEMEDSLITRVGLKLGQSESL